MRAGLAAAPATSHWSSVAAVAAGIFVLVTSELLPIGLLTVIAADLDVGEAVAALMVTGPGIVAAVAAPLLTTVTGRFDRRVVLCALMATLAVANTLTAVAPTVAVVLLARLLVGVSIGGFWAIAGGLAVRLVRAAAVARATAVIMSGVSLAAVVGVPVGALLGDLGGWRAPFLACGVLSLIVLAGLVAFVPPLPPAPGAGLRMLVGAGRLPVVRVLLAVAALLVTGHFAGYAYVRPVIEHLVAADTSTVTGVLLAIGVAGVIGTAVVGELMTRRGRAQPSLVAGAVALTMVAVPLVAVSGPTAVVLLCAWGMAYGGVSVTLQTWVAQAVPHATEGATSLLVAVFNLAIAAGAVVGGAATGALGTTGAMWVGGGLAALAALVATRSRSARPATTADTTADRGSPPPAVCAAGATRR